MSLSFRQSDILDHRQAPRAALPLMALAERFGVTVQTIRRDLSESGRYAGKLDRVHGGAVLRSGVSNIGYEDRRTH